MEQRPTPLTPRQVYYMLREDWPMELGKGPGYSLHLTQRNAAGQTLETFFIEQHNLSPERAREASTLAHAIYNRKAPDLTGKLTPELVMYLLPNDWPIIENASGLAIAPNDRTGKSLGQYLREPHKHTMLPPNRIHEALQLLERFVAQTNHDITHIRKTTSITSQPTLVMAEPNQPPIPDTHRNADPLSQELTFSNRFHWYKLRRSLEASGALVMHADDIGKSNLNAVWMRNLFTLAPDNAVIFSGPPRIYEDNGERPNRNRTYYNNFVRNVEALKKKFADQGIPTRTLEGFNDGGDVLLHRQSNTVFIGITVNADGSMNEANIKHAQEMADTLKMKLAPIPKTAVFDHYYYHLDLIMMIVPDGSIVYVPDATNEMGRKAIEAVVPNPADRLELPIQGELTPTHVAANSITINGNVFGQTTPEMKAFLEGRGFKVYDGPYQIEDGGVHCETNMVQHDKPDGRTNLSALMPKDLKRLQWSPADSSLDAASPQVPSTINSVITGLG